MALIFCYIRQVEKKNIEKSYSYDIGRSPSEGKKPLDDDMSSEVQFPDGRMDRWGPSDTISRYRFIRRSSLFLSLEHNNGRGEMKKFPAAITNLLLKLVASCIGEVSHI